MTRRRDSCWLITSGCERPPAPRAARCSADALPTRSACGARRAARHLIGACLRAPSASAVTRPAALRAALEEPSVTDRRAADHRRRAPSAPVVGADAADVRPPPATRGRRAAGGETRERTYPVLLRLCDGWEWGGCEQLPVTVRVELGALSPVETGSVSGQDRGAEKRAGR